MNQHQIQDAFGDWKDVTEEIYNNYPSSHPKRIHYTSTDEPEEEWLTDGQKKAYFENIEQRITTIKNFAASEQGKGIDLKKLEEKFDEVFNNTTPEQFDEWLKAKLSEQGKDPVDKMMEDELDFVHSAVRNMDFDLGFKTGFLAGHSTQEEKKYTEEDMRERSTSFAEWLADNGIVNFISTTTTYYNDYLQSLK